MKRKSFIMVITATWLVASCAGIPGDPSGKCLDREGYCFDATINGQAVIPLQSQVLIAPYQQRSHYLDDTAWQLAHPISGALDVTATANDIGQDWIGNHGRVQVGIVPLGNYKIASRQVLSHDSSVRVSDKAVTVVKSVLQSNHLPAGGYLFRIKLRGSKNWDRKTVFVVVE